MSKYVWFGTDVSPKCSLFDNGLLMKRESKGFYRVCVCIGDKYCFGAFWLDSWLEDTTEDEWKKLADLVGMDVDEYKSWLDGMTDDQKAAELATDLQGITDYDTLFGWTSWEPQAYSENEIKIRLNRALAA